MIAARAAAFIIGLVAAVSLIFVESPTVESASLAGIVLAAVLIIAWSFGAFTREPRPPRPVSPFMERPATPEERARWAPASQFFDQDEDYSRLDRMDGLDTRH